MGFSAALYVIPKYNRASTPEEVSIVSSYLEYENNSWAKQHFNNAEEYVANYKGKNVKIPSKDVIDYYRTQLYTDEYGSVTLYKSMADWCSNGSSTIHPWFESQKKTSLDGNENRILSFQDVLNFLLFCWGEYEKLIPEPCTLNYAFKYVTDDENWENPEIHLIPCDGIEVTFEEDGTSQRIETNPEYGCDFSAPRKYYDISDLYAYREGITGAIKILKEVDFDKQMVIYSGGW